MARTPLMAGNWKMNLNHQEAVVLVQKLAWTLSDKRHDYGKVEVVVVPPFTDLRSVQTLVDGDRLSIKYAAQDVSTAGQRRLHRRDLGGDAGQARLLLRRGRALRAPEYHAETDELVNAKAHKALAAGMTPIVCVGEGLDIRQAGDQVAYTLAQVDGSLAGFTRRAGRRAGRRLRARVGHRHRRGRHAGRRAGGLRRHPRAHPRGPRRCCRRRRARALRRLGEGSQRRRDHGEGRRRRRVWSVAPACRSTSSAGSAASTRCRTCPGPTREAPTLRGAVT